MSPRIQHYWPIYILVHTWTHASASTMRLVASGSSLSPWSICTSRLVPLVAYVIVIVHTNLYIENKCPCNIKSGRCILAISSTSNKEQQVPLSTHHTITLHFTTRCHHSHMWLWRKTKWYCSHFVPWIVAWIPANICVWLHSPARTVELCISPYNYIFHNNNKYGDNKGDGMSPRTRNLSRMDLQKGVDIIRRVGAVRQTSRSEDGVWNTRVLQTSLKYAKHTSLERHSAWYKYLNDSNVIEHVKRLRHQVISNFNMKQRCFVSMLFLGT